MTPSRPSSWSATQRKPPSADVCPRARFTSTAVPTRALKGFVRRTGRSDRLAVQAGAGNHQPTCPIGRAGDPGFQHSSSRYRSCTDDVLRCIDEAVQFPILFELTFAGRTQVVAAYKRPSETEATRWTLSDYFASDWLPTGCARAAMPVALNLASLYEQLLQPLIPLSARSQESLAELVARMGKVQTTQREVDKTIERLEKEKQFNRKVEINATLRKLKSNLELLGDRK